MKYWFGFCLYICTKFYVVMTLKIGTDTDMASSEINEMINLTDVLSDLIRN